MSRFRELLLKISTCAKILGVFLPISAVRRGKCHINLTFREKYEPFSSHKRKFLATTLEKSANRVSLGLGVIGHACHWGRVSLGTYNFDTVSLGTRVIGDA